MYEPILVILIEDAGGVIFGTFSKVVNVRPEVYSDVISFVNVDSIGVKFYVKFVDFRPNRCRDICPPAFGQNPDVKLWPSLRPPVWWLEWTLGSKMVFDICTHNRPILHRLASLHNAADRRQTDRAIGLGRLCNSIAGLKRSSQINR